MEGAMVDHVARLVAGQGIYVAPSVHFVPYVYNPLFYAVAAAVARVVGVGFLPLRLVSVVSTLATFALIFELVRRETRALFPSFLAAGLYASTYAIAGSWFDGGRVDPLAIALCVASIFVARQARTPARLVASAALVALAFATRQNALPLLFALWLYFALALGVKRSLAFAAPAVVVIAAGVLTVNHATNGWYWFYAFELPLGHSPSFAMLPQAAMLPLVVAIAFGVQYFRAPAVRAAEAGRFFLLSLGALALMSVAGVLHSGSFYNDYMPLYAALSVAFGLGLHEVLHSAPDHALRGRLALGASVLQFAGLAYDPRPYAPGKAELDDGRRLVRAIAAIPGDVFVPEHGYVVELAGKRPFLHLMAFIDLVRVPGAHEEAAALTTAFDTLIAEHRFGAIVLDAPTPFQDATARGYVLAARIPFHEPRYFFATEDRTAFHFVWVPKAAP
jgi:hypothetical protein